MFLGLLGGGSGCFWVVMGGNGWLLVVRAGYE